MNTQYLSKIQEKKFVFLVEREKLRNNLEVLRKRSEQTSVLTSELKSLFEELASVWEDTRSLQRDLNRTAIDFGLQPTPTKLRWESLMPREE